MRLHCVRLAVCVFLLLLAVVPCPAGSQAECFPADSGFARARCTCEDSGRAIHCVDDQLTEFPVLDRTYPDVEDIFAEKHDFTQLNRSHMEKFPNLIMLRLNEGRISRISNDAFQNNTLLEIISLHDNELTAFPPVANLQQLQELYVGQNNIQSLKPGDLQGCSNLTLLEAPRNDIKELRNGVFSGLQILHTLDLNHNKRLSTIEEDVFVGCAIQTLSLSNTAIRHLPSAGMRTTLFRLDLSDTRNLKRYNAYEPGVEFFNQTYVFLQEVEFYYHAHCCQMQDHQYYQRVLSTRDTGEEDYYYEDDSTLLMPHSVSKREVPVADLSGYACVNTTNRSIVENTSSIALYEEISASEFCSSQFCMEEICGESCPSEDAPENDMMDSSGGGLCDIYCIAVAPSSCLDKFFDPSSFSSQVTYNACATDVPTETPTTPPPPPPIPDCNDYDAWCSHFFTGHINTLCQNCAQFACHGQNHCKELSGLYESSCPCDMSKRSVRDNGDIFTARTLRSASEMEPADNGSRNVSMDEECGIITIEVVCRQLINDTVMATSTSLLLEPTPSPGADSRQGNSCEHNVLENIGDLLLPSGWFYPDPDSRDTICSEIMDTPDPTLPPSTPEPVISYIPAHLTECSPVPDDFNPCEDLLGDSDVLRAAIWLVIILAFLGNGTVLFVFFTYTIVIRRTKIKFFPMHFLYANLAGADFLMSIYLLTLASVDIDTKGRFSMEDIAWRTGPGCSFAGFCAITSTVVSVYTLVVITSERLYTITFVMHQRKLNKKFVFTVMGVGWLIGVTMGALPTRGEVNSYELVAVCLPFDTKRSSALAYIVIILLLTGLAFIYIAFCYCVIFYQIVLSPSKRKLVRSGHQKQWKADLRMSVRMFVLVLTNFLCWFPIALVSLTAAFGVPLQGINVATAKVFVVFVFPLNACVNPFLYSLSTRAFKNNFFALLARCGLRRDTATSVANSRVFGFLPSTATRTTHIEGSRRSSVISQLIALNFTMFTNHRASLSANSVSSGSNLNLRRPSQVSEGSNEDRFSRLLAFLHIRRGSQFSQNSNDDFPSHQETTLYSMEPTSTALSSNGTEHDGEGKLRTALNSGSSLGILHEVDEVADMMQGSNIVELNPGYQDQNDAELEEDKLGIGHIGDHTLDNGLVTTLPDIVRNGSLEEHEEHHIVATMLHTDRDSSGEHQSDTMSVTEDIHHPPQQSSDFYQKKE